MMNIQKNNFCSLKIHIQLQNSTTIYSLDDWLWNIILNNRSTGKSPFEIVHGYKPNKPIDLIPLLIHA